MPEVVSLHDSASYKKYLQFSIIPTLSHLGDRLSKHKYCWTTDKHLIIYISLLSLANQNINICRFLRNLHPLSSDNLSSTSCCKYLAQTAGDYLSVGVLPPCLRPRISWHGFLSSLGYTSELCKYNFSLLLLQERQCWWQETGNIFSANVLITGTRSSLVPFRIKMEGNKRADTKVDGCTHDFAGSSHTNFVHLAQDLKWSCSQTTFISQTWTVLTTRS